MNDRALGTDIFLVSLLGLTVYFWLVFLSPWSLLVIQTSVFFAVAALLIIIAWIGHTLTMIQLPQALEGLMAETEEKRESSWA
jgi:predicted DNA-binding transcriptional regulator